jgi:hypothetical protein
LYHNLHTNISTIFFCYLFIVFFKIRAPEREKEKIKNKDKQDKKIKDKQPSKQEQAYWETSGTTTVQPSQTSQTQQTQSNQQHQANVPTHTTPAMGSFSIQQTQPQVSFEGFTIAGPKAKKQKTDNN